MGNTEKYSFTIDYIPEKPEKDEYNLTPSESVFFSQMEKNLKKYAADMNAPRPLETLFDNIHRLNRLFILFGRPWLADSGIIQKACAWYLTYGKPTKEEARTLIETLKGFTSVTCCLSEWNGLISRMQEFFSVQEKELRRLFEYEKEMKKKREERLARMLEDGVTYSMTIGKGEIYGVTYPQMENLYRVMGLFIEREKAPFECKVKNYDEYTINVSKNVGLYSDEDEFYVSYNLDTSVSDLNCMSAEQMKRVANAISDFLKLFGENGDKKVRWDIADYSGEELPEITFEVKEDGRQPTFRTAPWVSKCINKEENKEIEINYWIDVNEKYSPDLSFGEFIRIYRKLGDFLSKPVKV